jgi:hypothetical protein
VVAALTSSTYLDVGGEVVWLGRSDGSRHPRAIEVSGEVTTEGAVSIDAAGLAPWPRRGGRRADARTARQAARELIDRLRRGPTDAAPPGGLGRLLVGTAPDFPLERAAGAVERMAIACERDDAAGAEAAAAPLLGLGPGLTPAGDDLVGGVLFARHAVAGPDPGWTRAAAAIAARARSRTHPISATLLADLAAGEGWDPLHDLVEALGAGASAEAWAALGRLSRLGHSSGWDLATGALVGLAGRLALAAGPADPGASPGGLQYS